jgi:hypothetical protein
MIVVVQADMQNDILASLSRLSDAQLVAQVKSLVARERDATAQIVAHLAELDTRDVYLRARGKRKPEVEEIVARLSPRPDVPPSVRRLPAPRSPFTTPPPPVVTSTLTTPDPSSIPTPAPDQAVRPLSIRPAAVEPLSPDRYKLQLTIGGETLEKLRLAKDMLGRAIPPLRCNAPSGCGISGDAPSSGPAAIAATNAGSSSSTTSIHSSWAARRPSTRSSCGAGVTTTTRDVCTSASAEARANLFWNKFA